MLVMNILGEGETTSIEILIETLTVGGVSLILAELRKT